MHRLNNATGMGVVSSSHLIWLTGTGLPVTLLFFGVNIGFVDVLYHIGCGGGAAGAKAAAAPRRPGKTDGKINAVLLRTRGYRTRWLFCASFTAGSALEEPGCPLPSPSRMTNNSAGGCWYGFTRFVRHLGANWQDGAGCGCTNVLTNK
jgi:hypothetical protein